MSKWHRRKMGQANQKSCTPITARVPDSVPVMLKQAAKPFCSTVHQFVGLMSGQESQSLVLERETNIRLSHQGAQRILSILDHPPKPIKRHKEAVRVFKIKVE